MAKMGKIYMGAAWHQDAPGAARDDPAGPAAVPATGHGRYAGDGHAGAGAARGDSLKSEVFLDRLRRVA